MLQILFPNKVIFGFPPKDVSPHKHALGENKSEVVVQSQWNNSISWEICYTIYLAKWEGADSFNKILNL